MTAAECVSPRSVAHPLSLLSGAWSDGQGAERPVGCGRSTRQSVSWVQVCRRRSGHYGAGKQPFQTDNHTAPDSSSVRASQRRFLLAMTRTPALKRVAGAAAVMAGVVADTARSARWVQNHGPISIRAGNCDRSPLSRHQLAAADRACRRRFSRPPGRTIGRPLQRVPVRRSAGSWPVRATAPYRPRPSRPPSPSRRALSGSQEETNKTRASEAATDS